MGDLSHTLTDIYIYYRKKGVLNGGSGSSRPNALRISKMGELSHTHIFIKICSRFFLVCIYIYVHAYIYIYTYIYIYGGGQLKTKGNDLFKKGDFSEAAVW